MLAYYALADDEGLPVPDTLAETLAAEMSMSRSIRADNTGVGSATGVRGGRALRVGGAAGAVTLNTCEFIANGRYETTKKIGLCPSKERSRASFRTWLQFMRSWPGEEGWWRTPHSAGGWGPRDLTSVVVWTVIINMFAHLEPWLAFPL